MTDIQIKKGRDRSMIRALSPKGAAWLKENINSFTYEIAIDNEFVEDFKKELKDLEVQEL